MSMPARHRAALARQHERQAAAAADVEHARAVAHLRGVEHRLEQRPVVRLGEVGPRLRIGAPQPALDGGGGVMPPPQASRSG